MFFPSTIFFSARVPVVCAHEVLFLFIFRFACAPSSHNLSTSERRRASYERRWNKNSLSLRRLRVMYNTCSSQLFTQPVMTRPPCEAAALVLVEQMLRDE